MISRTELQHVVCPLITWSHQRILFSMKKSCDSQMPQQVQPFGDYEVSYLCHHVCGGRACVPHYQLISVSVSQRLLLFICGDRNLCLEGGGGVVRMRIVCNTLLTAHSVDTLEQMMELSEGRGRTGLF